MRGYLAVAVLIAGCSNLDVQEIKTAEGQRLGYLATYEHTRDFGGWQNGAVIYDRDGRFIDHQADRIGAVLPEVLKAGAIVGSGYLIGRGLASSGDDVQLNNSSASGSSSKAGAYAEGGSATAVVKPQEPVHWKPKGR